VSGRSYDAVVIGAGHNGLVAAASLARGGRHVAVLERRDVIGGILAESEVAPGVRVPAIAHTVGRLRPSLIRTLELERHGLRLIRPAVRAFAPQPEGRPVTMWSDPARTAADLRSASPRDAAAYVAFDRRVRSMASFLAHLAASAPPEIGSPSIADAIQGLRLARGLRRLGWKAARETLRVLPMPVADLVGEVFEGDHLQAAIASRGVLFTAMGPWTAGTAAVLLNDSAGNDGGAAGQTVYARGGPAALAAALGAAARTAGAEIRTEAEVVSVLIQGGRVRGVVLASGEELRSPVVVSGLDPKRTLLGLVDPEELGPTMVWRASNIRTPGAVAKVNLALSGVPVFAGADGATDRRLHGRILIAPGIDDLERAADAVKYGRISQAPFLEATIPSLADPTVATEGYHAMSVIVQGAPHGLREGSWDAERDGLGDLVVKRLEEHAPGLSDLIVAREVLTPADLEREFGLTGGHVLHAEPGLDQFFAWRPLHGFARYRMPIEGLYLCGSGGHPGGGVTGAPGANAAREVLADFRRGRRRASWPR
jgi:phytoene dehydrogenase-like protein